ncbi:mucin-16 [Echinops telfairi]|uniref:Mucin-16 n=1 Tax=Echinops telfairi TaxID=9371 RepID=A0AC59C745_ECHTE|nr:mucin-16 [Echinops telfairi]
MEPRNQTSASEFILLGLAENPDQETLLFALFFCMYVITAVGNLLIILAISSDSQLHTPMYFFLANLSLVDFCLATDTVPKMLMSIQTRSKSISYPGCLTQMYFFHFFGIMDSVLIAVMAYDRATETEALPSVDDPVRTIGPSNPLLTPLPDPLSTVDWTVEGSRPPVTITTSAPQGSTTSQELYLETAISPVTTTQLLSSVGSIPSVATPDAIISSNAITPWGSQSLRETEQSPPPFPTTTSATPWHASQTVTILSMIPPAKRTPDPTPQAHGVGTPTTEATGTSDSWAGEETTSNPSLNTHVQSVSSSLGGTIKMATGSSDLLKTTDMLNTGLESVTSRFPTLNTSTSERSAPSALTTDKEAVPASINTVEMSVWTPGSRQKLHSTTLDRSEPLTATSPMVTSSTLGDTIGYTLTPLFPESSQTGTETDPSVTTTTIKSKMYRNASSITETSAVFPPGSTAVTEGSRRAVTASDIIPSPGLSQSTSSLDVLTGMSTTPASSPLQTGSTRTLFTNQKASSRATSLSTPTLDTSTTGLWEGTRLPFSESSGTTAPMGISSSAGDTTISTSTSAFSENKRQETETKANAYLTHGLRETSPSQVTSSSTVIESLLSHASTGAATMENSWTELAPSSKTFMPSPAHFPTTHATATKSIASSSASLLRTESAGMTFTTQVSGPGTTSQGTLPLDSPTTAFGAGTQSFPHSKMTTLLNTDSKDVPRMSSSVGETSSLSSLAPIPSTTSPSLASSTLQEHSSPVTFLVTSSQTSSLVEMTDMLRMSSETDTSTSANLDSTSSEISATSEDTTDTEVILPSTKISVTTVGAASPGHKSHSSALAHSEAFGVTSLVVITSALGDATFPTSMPPSFDSTRIEPTSSLTSNLKDTITSQETSVTKEKATVLPNMLRDTMTTEPSRTTFPSSDSTFNDLTRSTGISSGATNRPSLFPPMSESTHMTFPTQRGSPEAISLSTLTLDTSTPGSWEGTQLSFSRPSETINPINTALTKISTSPSASSETNRLETDTIPNQTPGWQNMGISQMTTSVTEAGTVLSHVSTEAATTAVSWKEFISSSKISITDPTRLKSFPNTSIQSGTTALRTESSEIPFTTQADSSGVTSKGALTQDTSAMASWARLSSVVTQGFPPSEMTNPMSTSSEDVSRISPLSSKETSSSSLFSFPATTSPPPGLSTLQGYSLSSPSPVTPLITSGLLKSTDMLGTSFKSSTGSSLPNLSITSSEILVTSQMITNRESTHSSTNTVTNVAATSPGPTSHSVLSQSQLSKVTSPEAIVSSKVSITSFTATPTSSAPPTSSDATKMETASSSSLTTIMKDPSTLQGTTSDRERPTVLSEVSTSTTATGLSKTEIPDSGRTPILGSTQSTWSWRISGTSSRATIPHPMTGSAQRTLPIQALSPEPTESLDALNLDTLPTVSLKGTQLASSKTPGGTSSLVTSTDSTLMPELPEITRIDSESTSSLTPGLTNYSTSQMNVLATDVSSLPSQASIDATEFSRTEEPSSDRMTSPDPDQSKGPTDITTESSTSPPDSPLMTTSEGRSLTSRRSASGPTSQDALTLHMPSTAFWEGTSLDLTQGFPQSETMTLMSRRPGEESTPPSEADVNSLSSLAPISATSSPSAVSSKFQGQSVSSTLPITSILTSAPKKTTDNLEEKWEVGTSLPLHMSSTSSEVLASSEVTIGTETTHPSTNIVATVRTTNSGHVSPASVLAPMETSRAMFPIVTASKMVENTVSASMSASSPTTRIGSKSDSSLTDGLSEYTTTQVTVTSTERTPVLLQVSTTAATIEVPRIEIKSTERLSSPSPAESKGLTTLIPESHTISSTLPRMAESVATDFTTQTDVPGATLQGSVTWNSSTTASLVGTPSTVTQGLHPSDVITLSSKEPVDVSRMNTSPIKDTDSVNSLVPTLAMSSSTSVSSISQGENTSSSLHGISSFTSIPLRNTNILDTTLAFGTSSSPHLRSTSDDTLTISEATKNVEAVNPSINTAVGTTHTGHKVQSTVLAPTVTSRVISSAATLSSKVEVSVSTSLPAYTEIRGETQAESTSSLTHGQKQTITSRESSLVTDAHTGSFYASTGAAREDPGMEAISSGGTSMPGTTHFQKSPQEATESNPNRPTSPLRTGSSGMPFNITAGPPRVTSQDAFTRGTATTNSWAGIPPVLTQGFPHSDMTTPVSTGPPNISSSPSVEEGSTLSSMAPTTVQTSLSSVSSMLQEDNPSSSFLGTSIPTAKPENNTTANLDKSFGSGSRPPPDISSTPEETTVTSEVTIDSEAIHPSSETTEAMKTTSSEHMSLFSVTDQSEPKDITSSGVATSSMADLAVSTSAPAPSETTKNDTKSSSSLMTERRKNSTSPRASSTTETYTNLAPVSTDTSVTEPSKKDIAVPDRTPIPGSTLSTWSPGIPSETSRTSAIAITETESGDHVTFTTENVSTEASTLATTTLGTLSTFSMEETQVSSSRPTRATSLLVTTSSIGDTTVSALRPVFSETTKNESELPSSLTTGLRGSSTPQVPYSVTETKSVLSHSSTGPVTAATEDISLDRMSHPTPNPSKESSNTLTESNVSPSTAPLMKDSEGMTLTTQRGTRTSDTSSTASRAETPSVLTQSFPHSEMTAHMSTDPNNVLSSPSVEEASPLSSMAPTAAKSSFSSVSSMLQGGSVSSPLLETSVVTSSSEKTTANLETSLGPDTSPLPDVSSTSDYTLSPTVATIDTEATHPSTETTDFMSATSSEPVALSFVPDQSEPYDITSPGVATSGLVDLTVSTSASSETTRNETEPSSSVTSVMREPGTSQQTSSLRETSSILAHVSTDASTTDLSKTGIPWPDKAQIPHSTRSTWSPGVSSEVHSTSAMSLPETEPAAYRTFTPESVSTEPTSLDTTTFSTQSTVSMKETQDPSSRPTRATSPPITTSNIRDTTVSELTPVFSENAKSESELTPSVTAGASTTAQVPYSAPETKPVLSHVSRGTATAGLSRAEVTSSDRLTHADADQTIGSTDVLTETSINPSTSPLMKDAERITLTTERGILTLGTSTTASWSGTPSVLTQGFPHSEMTAFMSGNPKEMSSTPSVEEVSSLSSMAPTTENISPFSGSSVLQGVSLSSPLLGTSPVMPGPEKTTTKLKTSLGLGSRPPPEMSSTSDGTLTTSEATIDTEAIHPSTETTDVMSAISSEHAHSESPSVTSPGGATSSMVDFTVSTSVALSFVPAHAEPCSTTSPGGATSSVVDFTVSTEVPASSETTRIETKPSSSVITGMSEISTPQGFSAAAETSSDSHVSTDASTPEFSNTDIPSSYRTPIPGSTLSTWSPEISPQTSSSSSMSLYETEPPSHGTYSTKTISSEPASLEATTLDTLSMEETQFSSSTPIGATSPMVTTSITGHTTVSIITPVYSETTDIESELTSSLAPGLRESSTLPIPYSATETIPVLSHVSSRGTATTEVSRTEVTSSNRISHPVPDQTKSSTNVLTENSISPSTSPFMKEYEGITLTTETDTFTPDTSVSASGSPSDLTQGFPHSEITTLISRGPKDVPSSFPVEETSSLSSMTPTTTNILFHSGSPMLQGGTSSSPLLETSVVTSVPEKTTASLQTSLEPSSRVPSEMTSTSDDTMTVSGSTIRTEATHPSTETAGIMSTSSSEHSSLSFVPAHSEPYSITSPGVATSSMAHFTVSTEVPASSETTRIETKPAYSLTTGMAEDSTYPGSSSATETYAILSPLSTDAPITELSKTKMPSSDRTPIPGSTQFTWSPETSSATSSTASISLTKTEMAANVNVTTEPISSEATPLDAHTLGSLSTVSMEETQFSSSRPSRATSPLVTTSIIRDIPGSVLTPSESELVSSQTMGLRESSTPQVPYSATETKPVLSHVSIGTATAGASRTEVTSSDRISHPVPAKTTSSSAVPTENSISPSTPPLLKDSEGITLMAEIGVFTLNTSTTAPGVRTPSVSTQGFPHSEMTTLMGRGPKDVSSSFSVEETSTLSTIGPTTATKVPHSSVSPGLEGNRSFSPLLGTSAVTAGPVKTTPNVDTALGPDGTPTPEVSSPADDTMTIPESTIYTEAIHPSTETIGVMSPSNSEQGPFSTVPAHSEPYSITSPVGATSSRIDLTVSSSAPASAETTKIETKPLSSIITGMRETSTTQGNSFTTETLSILSDASTTELSNTEFPSTETTLMLGSTKPTSSPGISADTRSTAAPSLTETGSAAPMTFTTQTFTTAPTSLATTTLGQLSTDSTEETLFSSSGATAPPTTTSILGHTVVSVLIPVYSETTKSEKELTSPLTTGLREPRTSQAPFSATETKPVLSHVSTGTATASRTEVTSSDQMSPPVPDQTIRSADILTENSVSPSTSSLMKNTEGFTLETETGILTLDTSATTPWAGTSSVLTQGFPHLQRTTSVSKEPKDVSSSPSVDETSLLSSLSPITATTSSSPISLAFKESSPSPLPVTSTFMPDLLTTSAMLRTSLKPGTSSPSILSNPSVVMNSTPETTLDTKAIHLSTNTMTTLMTTSSAHESRSSVSTNFEPPRTTDPVTTAFTMEATTISPVMSASLETTSIEPLPLSHLTPGLTDTSISLHRGSAIPTHPPASTHLLKDPKTDVTSSVTISASDQSLFSPFPQIPVETATHLYASPSVIGSSGVTSPESTLAASVSEGSQYSITDMLPSPETIPADTSIPPLPEFTTSFGATGILGTNSAPLSSSSFSKTESSPEVDLISTVSDSLPSLASTSFTSSTFTATNSPPNPSLHGMTSSPATTYMVYNSLGTESSTQEIKTSLSPLVDTRRTESADLEWVTSGPHIPSHSTSLTTAVPFLIPFTLNFTITNLQYTEDMQLPGSGKFNFTEKILQHLLRPLLKNSSLGFLFSDCRLASLRPGKEGAATRVDAICTHHPDPEGSGLDRERLYWELSQMTHGVAQLGPYPLARDSLYVNGFTHQGSAPITITPGTPTMGSGTSKTPSSLPRPTVTSPTVVLFTLNFTITNLHYTEDMGHPGSAKFNTTEKVLQQILGPVFKNTSIGTVYSICHVTSFRSEKGGAATRMDAVCTYRSDPKSTGLDRERLYWELSHETRDVTRLGPYTLDRDSLYVNGYTHQALLSTSSTTMASPATSTSLVTIPTATGPALMSFTLNFTITNLPYQEDMHPPGSLKYNVTEMSLQPLLDALFKNTSIGPFYSGCRLSSFRSKKNGTATGVDAICTYRPDPEGPDLNREWIYWELYKLTHGVIQLGPYTLDRNSLYVNGYTHQTLVTTTSTSRVNTASSGLPTLFSGSTVPGPALVPFTLNFTITNLHYMEDMQPGSAKFNSTESILQQLLKVSSVFGDLRSPFLDLSKSQKDGEATGVDIICTHHPDPTGFGLNREQLYWELSHQTHGITQLGPYNLDKNSLYVNGYTSTVLTPIPTVASTVTLFPGTSATPIPSSSSTARGPVLVPFTLNFTITNLQYTEDMGLLGSLKFNTTEKVLQHLLMTLLKNTSIGSLYSGCRLKSLSPEKNGAATGVDAICTHRLDPESPSLDRERLYWELHNLTKGVTQLGSYILDNNSLYVNGYTHRTSATTSHPAEPVLVPFTLNFTITNLRYTDDMEYLGSSKFNFTERILQRLLGPLFYKTNVATLYSGCTLTSLRPQNEREATRVDALCTYHPDPEGPVLDREKLYWELSKLTLGVTQLGPYTLDKDSLYVNGYTHWASTTTSHTVISTSVPASSLATTFNKPTAAEPSLVPFTLNFTITNLHYTEDLGGLGSSKFNFTEKILQHLLGPLFNKTSIGPLYFGCTLTSLRPKKDRESTRVDAVCTHRPDPESPSLDRERLYWELSKLTQGVTQLGPYTLDKNSLYVNGYTHWALVTTPNTVTSTSFPTSSMKPTFTIKPTATEPAPVPFTLNFTITNLRYTDDMELLGSAKFNFTERILQRLLGPLFNKTSVGFLYKGCTLTSLRSKHDGESTRVDAICTHRLDPESSSLDRERLYWELSKLTQGITQLGPYTLDKDSLYVNGYTHWITTTISNTLVTSTSFPTTSMMPDITKPTAFEPALIPFTLNFTITNLHYTDDMEIPGSAKFNFTERILQRLLQPLFNKTSIGHLYSACTLTSLRPKKDGEATRMDAICTHQPDSEHPILDRERIYWELNNLTQGVTQLGPYTLDKSSLYVNGYTYWEPATTSQTAVTPTSPVNFAFTTKPTATEPSLVPFTLNFTITNLRYTDDMEIPGSAKFNFTEKILQRLLGPLFNRTSIRHLYSACTLTSLRPKKDGEATRIDAICSHQPDPERPILDRERIYWELNNLTQGVTQLGPYILDKNSLYVNGYTYWEPATTSQTTEPALVPFTLNFTITNLRYTDDMGIPGSAKFNFTEKILQQLLEPLFNKTSIRHLYFGCTLTSLRPKKVGDATKMDAICTHQPDPERPILDRERIYWELNNLTQGIMQLGPYTLDKNSLYVNGYTYWEPSTTSQTVTLTSHPTPSVNPAVTTKPTATEPALVPFTLNFTITNLRYTDDMETPGSAKFNFTERVLQRLLGPLFNKTSVGPLYYGCTLASLRSKKGREATRVDAICTHRPDPESPSLDREWLYWELSKLTQGVTQLGSYTLDKNSLYVNGYTHWKPATTSNQLTVPSWYFSPAAVTSASFPAASMVPAFTMKPTAAERALVPFTLNFTITNLRYTDDMETPGSAKFNFTERILQRLLGPLFNKTSVGPLYSGCTLTSLRTKNDRESTRVNAICTHSPDPESPSLDREWLYWELSKLTQGVTQLGPYTLDKNSLYVNGYTHREPATSSNTAVTPTSFSTSSMVPAFTTNLTAAGPALIPFTLNFTITNLRYTDDMGVTGSAKFNFTERILQHLFGPLFNKTSVGPIYAGCTLTLLRPQNNREATRMDAICTHHPDPESSSLDREWLYWELSKLTQGVTQLGPYTLDKNSLYVNGYTHWEPVTTYNTGVNSTSVPTSSKVSAFTIKPTTAAEPALVPFTLNFTITNLRYTDGMGHPGSAKFNYTERILQRLLGPLFNKTSVGPLYSGCRLALLRPEEGRATTGVDAVCTYYSDLEDPGLDREKLYWELSQLTYGVNRLEYYSLDRNSLYVNGYTYGASASTTTSGEVNEDPFTLSFTINNLRYSADMGRIGSHKFNITDTLMQHLLSPLFQGSSLGARYVGCRVTVLRSEKNGAWTGVDALCTYRQPPSGPGLHAKQVFHELSWQTRGITRLGPYSLDKDSLYLNGYNEPGPAEPPTTPELATTVLPPSSTTVQPEATTGTGYTLKTLTLNFTISNLHFSPDMGNPSSATFNSTERLLQHLLRPLFRKSSLGPFYSDCRLISLRPKKDRAATRVDIICTYHAYPAGHRLDRKRLFWELSQLTQGITQLGPYTLDRDSLSVDGYTSQSLSTQSEYQLNFRIINRNLSNPDPASSEYAALLWDLQDKVTTLYTGSQLQDVFRSGLVTDLNWASVCDEKKKAYDEADLVAEKWLRSMGLEFGHRTCCPVFQLNQLFRNSSIKSYFSSCQVTAFRSVYHSNHTGVDSLCGFSPMTRRPDRIVIYEEFLHLTRNGTQLQNFTLDRNSILVDGYSPNRHEALTKNPDLPFWAIILICLAGLLALITCLVCCFLVNICMRKKEGDYEVQRRRLGYYLPHLDLRKLQ